MLFLIAHRSLSSSGCWYFLVDAPSPRDAYKKIAIYIGRQYGLILSEETINTRFKVIFSYIKIDVLEIPPGKGLDN